MCFGTFLGAIFGELGGGNEVGQSLRVGVGAAKGRFLGTMSKVMFGIVMLLITMCTALPIRASRPANASTVATGNRDNAHDDPALK